MNRCATCDGFQRHDGIPEEHPITHQIELKPNPQGVCMAHPPVMHFGQTGIVSAYPTTKDSFGCFEWKEKVVVLDVSVATSNPV